MGAAHAQCWNACNENCDVQFENEVVESGRPGDKFSLEKKSLYYDEDTEPGYSDVPMPPPGLGDVAEHTSRAPGSEQEPTAEPEPTGCCPAGHKVVLTDRHHICDLCQRDVTKSKPRDNSFRCYLCNLTICCKCVGNGENAPEDSAADQTLGEAPLRFVKKPSTRQQLDNRTFQFNGAAQPAWV
eukprot:TRINITY_DN113383_c0_g1_i1.p1 TRINITY_DN113383_c0_g1~~TRINITY_DN113383_c0_g1_i1.p1  ORF type:complete len:192 (-),score=29.57 TRINITY_DN113383_c0_g1_i1:91-642(-)